MGIKHPGPNNYVGLIQFEASGQGSQVQIANITPDVVDALRSLGAYEQQVQGETVWVLEAGDHQVLGELLGKLRDLGILFGGDAAGWSPSAIFEFYRAKGRVQGKFHQVLWFGPDQWGIYTR